MLGGGALNGVECAAEVPLLRARSVMARSLADRRLIVDNMQKTIDSKNRACLDWLSPASQSSNLVCPVVCPTRRSR